jgi:hypothetical protein
MYNPEKQYRCTIIRGKAQTELDDLLPAYCRIIQSICPANQENFRNVFNGHLAKTIHNYTVKVLDNHRTEIAGKLFGLWYEMDGVVYCSEKAVSYLETSDNPAFFKDLVIKLQFPNGMDKIQTLKDRLTNKIKFRPTPFILAALQYANEKNISLYINEIAYYILNSLEVLQGKVDHNTVVNTIIENRKKGLFYRVSTEGKAHSYDMQHIREQLNLMELANLIRIIPEGIDKRIVLNKSEEPVISKIIDRYLGKLGIDPYEYNLDNKKEADQFYKAWDAYYTRLLVDTPIEKTRAVDLVDEEQFIVDDDYRIDKTVFIPSDPLSIGDEGENLAMEFEKQRVQKYNKRLSNKVIYFGKQRGLGYDISSIFAEGLNPEHGIFIEVKTNKRVTEPPARFVDSFDMTRNEWIAAEQHSDIFFIYRVYLYNKGAKILKMASPVKLKHEKLIFAEPIKYHVEFDNNAGTYIYEKK